MILLEIKEHGVLRNVALDLVQRDALLACGADIDLTPEAGLDGRWRIKAGASVGIVVVPGLALRITPKVPIDRLFVMLTAASGSIRWQQERSQFAAGASVEDVVAVALVEGIRQGLSSGLLRGYSGIEEESYVVRGAIDIVKTVSKRPATLMPLIQTPEYLQEDILENRILISAINALLPRVSSLNVRARLVDCRRTFADVTPLIPGVDLPKVQRSRLNARWWDTIELALLVLRCAGLDLPEGAHRSRTFLVNMNVVFERFVHSSLARPLSRRSLELLHNRGGLTLDIEKMHYLRPDLSIWSGGTCLFAGDCKYKFSGDGDARREDIYQCVAYAMATRLKSVTLIYAGPSSASRDIQLIDGQTTVRVRCIHLGAAPEELQNQCDRIAAEITESI